MTTLVGEFRSFVKYHHRYFVGSVVERLKRRTHDQDGLDSKLIRAILLCPWERHFTALFPCLVVLESSYKLKS